MSRSTRWTLSTLTLATALVTGGALALGSGSVSAAPAPRTTACPPGHTVVDPGEVPHVLDLQQAARRNTSFRTAAWTADTLQLTLMSIPVGGDVGLEMHPTVNQFFRVEAGSVKVMMGTDKALTYVKMAGPGDVVLIPAGTWHNLVNVGTRPLKLYSLYGPQQHLKGTVHKTQADDPHSGDPKPSPTVGQPTAVEPFAADPGAVPFVVDIEAATAKNTNFRTAAWTSSTLQLTLMDIKVGEDVGTEMHPAVDQLLRVERGRAAFYVGTSTQSLAKFADVKAGDAIMVPSGTWHNIVNTSRTHSLKLYSLYGPQQHPQGTIHVTKPPQD